MPGKHDFSFRLEATKKDGVQTGQTPRPNAPRPQDRVLCTARTNPWGTKNPGMLSASSFD